MQLNTANVRCPKCKAAPGKPCIGVAHSPYPSGQRKVGQVLMTRHIERSLLEKRRDNERKAQEKALAWAEQRERDRVGAERYDVQRALQQHDMEEARRLRRWLREYGSLFAELKEQPDGR